MVMARYYVRKTPKVGALLSCIAGTLFYLGNFEEAKKVLDLICKYCDTPEGNAYRVSLYAMIKAQEKDKEAVAFYVKELETLMSRLQSSCRQMKRHPCLSGSILIIAYIRLPKWQVWRLRRQSIVLM